MKIYILCNVKLLKYIIILTIPIRIPNCYKKLMSTRDVYNVRHVYN